MVRRHDTIYISRGKECSAGPYLRDRSEIWAVFMDTGKELPDA